MGLWTWNTECISAGSSLVNNFCNSAILFTGSLNYLKHSDNKYYRFMCYIGQNVQAWPLPCCLAIILGIYFQFTKNIYFYITIHVHFQKIQTVVPKQNLTFKTRTGRRYKLRRVRKTVL
jgi:hypothetical protein